MGTLRYLRHITLSWSLCAFAVTVAADGTADAQGQWSPIEIRLLRTLSLANLPPASADWRNPLAGNAEVVELGRRLFEDTRLSGDGSRSCRSCHDPAKRYQDGLATSVGASPLRRNAPSLLGTAHRRWWYWDGRKDSLWSQALEPIETRAEMAGTRSGVARVILADEALRVAYERIFSAVDSPGWVQWPARASPQGGASEQAAWAGLSEQTRHAITAIFVNAGKAIAAFEATLTLPSTRFDRFVDALADGDELAASELLNAQEQRGLRVFIGGDSGCASCHLGPLFATDSFRNIGTGTGTGAGREGQPDTGRLAGRDALVRDEFNCAGPWSGAPRCPHLEASNGVEVGVLLNGSFRTPTLRNLVGTAPYMHDGRFDTLEAVMEHYRSPPSKASNYHEIPPLDALDDEDVRAIVAFLKALSPDADD